MLRHGSHALHAGDRLMVRLTTAQGAVSRVRGGASISTVVYESQIDAMFQPGGDVVDYANDNARDVAIEARSLAPVRDGILRAFIRAVPSRSMGKRHVRSSVRSAARHSLWVHEGTRDMYGMADDWQKLPAGGPKDITNSNSRHPVPSHFRPMVIRGRKGQRANPFLRNALRTAVNEWGVRGVPRAQSIYVRARGMS